MCEFTNKGEEITNTKKNRKCMVAERNVGEQKTELGWISPSVEEEDNCKQTRTWW